MNIVFSTVNINFSAAKSSFFLISKNDIFSSGAMAFNTLLQGYYEIPIVTRVFTSCCVATTIAVHLDLVSPFQLYFNPTLILQGQIWRLLTTFLFFGTIGFTFLFNMIFTYRYCRMLEETSFRGKTADFIVMFMFGAFFMVVSTRHTLSSS